MAFWHFMKITFWLIDYIMCLRICSTLCRQAWLGPAPTTSSTRGKTSPITRPRLRLWISPVESGNIGLAQFSWNWFEHHRLVFYIWLELNWYINTAISRCDPWVGIPKWQAWAQTEAGLIKACASYCLDRFQRYSKSRPGLHCNVMHWESGRQGAVVVKVE